VEDFRGHVVVCSYDAFGMHSFLMRLLGGKELGLRCWCGLFCAVGDDGLVVATEEIFSTGTAIGFLVDPFSACSESEICDFQVSCC